MNHLSNSAPCAMQKVDIFVDLNGLPGLHSLDGRPVRFKGYRIPGSESGFQEPHEEAYKLFVVLLQIAIDSCEKPVDDRSRERLIPKMYTLSNLLSIVERMEE
jgi:hypothetical protein